MGVNLDTGTMGGVHGSRLGRDPVAWRSTLPDHLKPSALSLDTFNALCEIGRPRWGCDYFVVDKVEERPYCLRKLSKALIACAGAVNFQAMVQASRLEMAQVHPFICKVYNGFEDRDAVYTVRDACQGADLATVLRFHHIFDDHTARFVAAGVMLAFEHLHAQGIAFRDLKPENVRLTSIGYPRLTDFTCAKLLLDARTYTVCGTPGYMAPEMIMGRGHTTAVDWWTLGVLIFEMLAGYTPFYDKNPMVSCEKVLSGHIVWPTHVGMEARALISQLLHVKATKRLGVHRDSPMLLRHEAWFASPSRSLPNTTTGTNPAPSAVAPTSSNISAASASSTSSAPASASTSSVAGLDKNDPQTFAYLPFDFRTFEFQAMPSPLDPGLSGPTDTSQYDTFNNTWTCPEYVSAQEAGEDVAEEPPWDALF